MGEAVFAFLGAAGMISLAWRDTIAFRPWPAAGWRSMYEIDLAR